MACSENMATRSVSEGECAEPLQTPSLAHGSGYDELRQCYLVCGTGQILQENVDNHGISAAAGDTCLSENVMITGSMTRINDPIRNASAVRSEAAVQTTFMRAPARTQASVRLNDPRQFDRRWSGLRPCG